MATPVWPGSVLNNTKSGSMRLFNITLPAAVGVVANGPNRATESKERHIGKFKEIENEHESEQNEFEVDRIGTRRNSRSRRPRLHGPSSEIQASWHSPATQRLK